MVKVCWFLKYNTKLTYIQLFMRLILIPLFIKPLKHSLFKKFIYLFIHERHTQRERQRHRQREKQAPCRKTDVGLDPWTPGWCPGPKAGAKLLSHPGVPFFSFNMRIGWEPVPTKLMWTFIKGLIILMILLMVVVIIQSHRSYIAPT